MLGVMEELIFKWRLIDYPTTLELLILLFFKGLIKLKCWKVNSDLMLNSLMWVKILI